MTAPETPKILLVDDRLDKLLALETILQRLPVEIFRAQSGKEALKQLLIHDFALIIFDIHMPEMSGLETAGLMRQRERFQHTPIIFVTAFDRDDAHVQQAYALGAVDYISTPESADVLRAKVASCVKIAQKERGLEEQIAQLRAGLAEAREQVQTWESQARAAGARLELFAGSAADYLFFTLDSQGKISGGSGPSENVLDVSMSALAGRSLADFLIEGPQFQQLLETARHQGRAEFDGGHRRPDGSPFWARTTVVSLPRTSSGREELAVIVHDLSSAKRAEANVLQARESQRDAEVREGEAREEAAQARVREEQAIQEREQAHRDAEEARSEAGQARQETTQARYDEAQARSEADQARRNADQARQEAEQAHQEAERARGEAAQARGEAEQARAEAAQARGEAEQARGEAAQARREAEEAGQRCEEALRQEEEARNAERSAKAAAEESRQREIQAEALTGQARENESQARTRAQAAERDTERAYQNQRRAEEAAQFATGRALEEKERSDAWTAAVTNFCSLLAADLGQQLKAFHSFAHLLKTAYSHQLDQDGRDCLSRINSSAGRMEVLRADLLDLTGNGPAAPKLEPTDLEKIIHESLRPFAGELKKSKATVVVESPMPRVESHGPTLEVVLVNMVALSLSASIPGQPPSLAFYCEKNGDRVRLWIVDKASAPDPEVTRRYFGTGGAAGESASEAPVRGTIGVRLGRVGGEGSLAPSVGEGNRFCLELPGAIESKSVPAPESGPKTEEAPSLASKESSEPAV